MAKQLSNTSSAIADALRASLGLYVRNKGTEGCVFLLAAWTLKCERMVGSGFNVGRHDCIRRERPVALITAKRSGAAVEDWLRLIFLARARP